MKNVVIALICFVVMVGISHAVVTNVWQGVPDDPGDPGALWGVATNWNLGVIPADGNYRAQINNDFESYYCIFDPANDPGIADVLTIENISIGNVRMTGEPDGELVVESGYLRGNYVYLGGDYVNKIGRVTVNGDGQFAAYRHMHIGPSDNSANKEAAAGILILNDNAIANDRAAYSYFTKVGGNPDPCAAYNESLLQLNDNSQYISNNLIIAYSGTVDVRDSATLQVNGGNDDTSQVPVLQQYIDDGKLIADGGASRIILSLVDAAGTTTAVAAPRPGGADVTAWNFQPTDGDVGVIVGGEITLRWVSGYNAASDLVEQRVYFGAESLVQSRDASTLIATLTKEQAVDVTGLTVGQEYFWAVDCEYADASVGSGAVQSFTAVALLESFESYADTTALQAVWGADAALAMEGYGSLQSMQVDYEDADVTVSASGSWNLLQAGSEEALTLNFKGATANTEAALSIALTDSSAASASVTYDGDIANYLPAIQSSAWTSWNIDLDDFAGVDLTDVTGIDITIDLPDPNGTGAVLFDQIGSRAPFFTQAPYMADISGNGVVDDADVTAFSEEWLFDTGVADDSAMAMVLDEGTGESTPGTATYEAGQAGQAVRFNSGGPAGEWLDIEDFLVGPFRDSTVSFWVKLYNAPSDGFTYSIVQASSAYRMYVTLKDGSLQLQCPVPLGSTGISTGQWYHVVMTAADTADGLSVCEGFINGASYGPVTGCPRHYGSGLAGINVGTYSNGLHGGKTEMAVDDIRFYDSVLSQADIANLYAGNAIAATPTVHYALDGNLDNSGSRTSVAAQYIGMPADINMDGKVDMADYADLAGDWMQVIKFPQ